MQYMRAYAEYAKYACICRICKIARVCRTKPNLSNQTYQTKPTKPNLPNQIYQTKPTKPKLLVKAVKTWVRSAFGNVSSWNSRCISKDVFLKSYKNKKYQRWRGGGDGQVG